MERIVRKTISFGDKRRGRRTRLLARRDPPPILNNPFTPLDLEFNWSGAPASDFIIRVSDVSQFILDQLGIALQAGQNLAFRILEIGVWELTGKGLEVSFHDLDDRYSVDADYAPIVTKLDTPGRNGWAHVHYRFPIDNRNNTLRAEGDHANFQILAIRPGYESAGDSRVKAYIKVSWRTSKYENPGRRVLPTGAIN